RIWMGEKAQKIFFSRNITLEMIQNSFLQYVYGAITLAIVAGLVFGVFTWVGIKLWRNRSGAVSS
ncbi:MAG: DUF2062 domain-containing protein, partial [Bacteroidota bacterium]